MSSTDAHDFIILDNGSLDGERWPAETPEDLQAAIDRMAELGIAVTDVFRGEAPDTLSVGKLFA